MAHRDRVACMVAGARGCVGIRFRPQGRSRYGLDCLGVVNAAFAAAECRIVLPQGYRLSGHERSNVEAAIAAAGLVAVVPEASVAGDILVAFLPLGQAHFAVRTDSGLVEAHAAIGRVVERPWRTGEPWDGAWRLV